MNNNVQYFRVTTPIGDVWAHPLRDGELHIHSTPSTSVDFYHEGGKSVQLPVTVNRVACLVRGWMTRNASGQYVATADDWSMSRADGKGPIYDPKETARTRKAQPVIVKAVQDFMSSDAAAPLREAMNRAERTDAGRDVNRMTAEIAAVEALLAEKRAALAAAERRLAVAEGKVAECGCDLLAYPAGYECEHTRNA